MQKRVALVTGASRGLGEYIARSLHAAAYRVAVSDLCQSAAEAVAASLDSTGETCFALELDVRERTAFERARDKLIGRWGGTDILINNAALTQTVALMEITEQQFDDVIAVNTRSVLFGCQVFGKHFAERGFGRILNVSSLAAQNGGSGTGAHYAASKGGSATLTKVFAKELAATGVTVNSVAPGPLDLPIARELLTPERLRQIESSIPIGKLGDPQFVADAVLLLVAEHADSVTGACWDINGGLFMR
jgi:3-oxoacyl-[acyl-carrier protein] reductase